MQNLQGQYKLIEDSYADDVLNLVVAQGYGWYARTFSHELTNEQRAAYAAAEEQALARKIGVWSLPDPMPPWECRKLRKAGQKCR